MVDRAERKCKIGDAIVLTNQIPISIYGTLSSQDVKYREGHQSRKVIMSLGVAKESYLREVQWVGSARPAESKGYYESKGKKTGVKARGTLLRPFDVYPSSEATMLVGG